MRRALRLGTIALCALVSASALADVIYVDPDALGANDGSSWVNAFTDLQPALAAAASGDEVWVAAATYKPTATTDRSISFALENGVGLYGGFAGDETQRSERDPAANVTILSGDIGVAADASDNSYHVVVSDGSVTPSGALDGFTITGGQANGTGNDTGGGGIWMSGGAPTLANLAIVSNFASAEGGGMRVTGGSATLVNTRFASNSVAFGGFGGGVRTAVAFNCRNCEFRSNGVTGSVIGSGGISASGNLTLVNTIVAQNNPSGIHATGDSNTFENCTIASNAVFGLALFVSNNNSMTNTIIWANGTDGIFNDGASTLTATYNDTQTAALPGAGNISANPLFLAPPGDLRPGPSSPVVDAGNNGAVPVGVTTDIAGLPRFFDDPSVPDTGLGTPPIVDMGAHERVPLTVSAPSSAAQCAGTDVSFSVVAAGQAPLSYQWRHDGTPLVDGGRIDGAETDTLSIDDIVAEDAGDYDVVVTDGVGQSLTSPEATLTVNATPAVPTLTAPTSVAVGSTGNAANVGSNPGSLYNWGLTGGTISGGQGTSQVAFDAGAPGTSMLLSVSETNAGCTSPVASSIVQVDFLDVPPANPFHNYVIAIARAGITAGCGGGNYCRNNPVTREQMAVFLLRAKYGPSYSPPACTQLFEDVACPSTYANWIQQLYVEEITGGCNTSPLRYCPGNPVTRAQMAVFILKTEHGPDFDPPACTLEFEDVPCENIFSEWIEELYAEGVTGGCSVTPLLYCPDNSVTRGQMAVFLTIAFNLPL